MAPRVTAETRHAATLMRKWVGPRWRLTLDAEGYPVILGRYGRIEWHCDGQDCHGDPEPGPLLTCWTDRRSRWKLLLAIPGVRGWQRGDDE